MGRFTTTKFNPFGACIPVPVNAGFNSFSNLAYTTMIGVNENAALENSFVLSPNPGNGNFQLSLSLLHAQEIQVVVYDQLGRKVYSQNENAGAGMYSSTMNLASLSSGVYSVQVKTAQGFATKRLVIN